MGFFNKRGGKSAGIPELPELPNIPESKATNVQFNNMENSSLPSYPNSNLGERINENAIKDAVTYGEPEFERQRSMIPSMNSAIPSIPQKQAKNMEIEGQTFEPSINSRSGKKTIEVSEYEPAYQNNQNYPTNAGIKVKQTGPLFIQLEKFEDSIATLDDIKMQISEIESLMRSIQEIKNKEEENLIYWQKQIESIKARLDKVDRDLFGNM